MLMTNGIGATIGTLGAQAVVNKFCSWQKIATEAGEHSFLVGDWTSVWGIFALYAFIVAITFIFVFKYKKEDELKSSNN